MRTNIVAIAVLAAAVAAVSLIAPAPGYAQSRTQYDRCAGLAAQQGLGTRSASGRRFIERCLQRGAYRGEPREWAGCPPRDGDPVTRSSYPAWMCP